MKIKNIFSCSHFSSLWPSPIWNKLSIDFDDVWRLSNDQLLKYMEELMIETEGGAPTDGESLNSLSTAKTHFVRVTASQDVENLAEGEKVTASESTDGIKKNCIIRETTV